MRSVIFARALRFEVSVVGIKYIGARRNGIVGLEASADAGHQKNSRAQVFALIGLSNKLGFV